MKRVALIFLIAFGTSSPAVCVEPRAQPLRHRPLPPVAQTVLRKFLTDGPAEALPELREWTSRAADNPRLKVMFATASYEAWVLGGQADAALLEQTLAALREARALAPAMTLDERWVPPKLLKLWNETH